jgi:predicted short-subunit dehydrogenase-like oxidoreductase (DUF2520 family)
MLPGVAGEPSIAIVGPGSLGSALAVSLRAAGFQIREIVARDRPAALRKARALGEKTGARAVSTHRAQLDAEVIWFCVPDREIANAARSLASAIGWKGKVALHSSGALASDELAALRRCGASVGSLHPLMSFVRGSVPSLADVPFAVEGDAVAVRVARRIVRVLGGNIFKLPKNRKAAYHTFGAFVSPLLVAALATAEQVARAAGLTAKQARQKMVPIVVHTLANYSALGPAGAFSGPILRGDAETVRRHLRVLRSLPQARAVYLALARSALKHLPARNRKELERVLSG